MIPFPKLRSFYDKKGRIQESKIDSLLKNVKDMVRYIKPHISYHLIRSGTIQCLIIPLHIHDSIKFCSMLLSKTSSLQQVIGWYKCRQNTSCRMSFMEKMVTRELQSYFSKKMFGVEPLFALFTAERNANLCNVLFDYAFLFPMSR